MPRISYPVEQLEDPELCGYLDYAARCGTPRPESQAVRANVPAVPTPCRVTGGPFRRRADDHAVTGSAGVPARHTAQEQGVTEDHDEELLECERSDRYDERERRRWIRGALAWALGRSTMRSGPRAGPFSDEQIWSSGTSGPPFGQQRWIKALQLGHGEVLNRSRAGLAEHAVVR